MVAEPLPTRLPAGYRAHRGLAPRVGSPERRQLARRHARLVKCRSACPGKTRRDFAGFPVFDVVQTPTLWQHRRWFGQADCHGGRGSGGGFRVRVLPRQHSRQRQSCRDRV